MTNIKKSITALLVTLVAITAAAQRVSERYAVEYAPFKSNWFSELGLDMSLQNPYGKDFSKVFPNGKTFGVDAAIGKWFTPGIGLRLGINWENGIKLFENKHAYWLAPVTDPNNPDTWGNAGENMRRGGYLVGRGDVLFDVQNLFCGYRADRLWNLQLFVRAGGLYNFGVSKGSPLIGAGVGSTFRINDRLTAYVHAAYNGVSSGHSGVGTGLGSGSTGFLDINTGLQYRFGAQGFAKPDTLAVEKVTHTFWSDWFVRAGFDMTLLNPYNHDFSQVFPKGKICGIDAAIGKWFSPEVALRLHLNWGNSLFRNHSLEWMGYDRDKPGDRYKAQYVLFTLDVPVSFTNIIWGVDPRRRVDVLGFARAGVVSNLSLKSASPSVGGGLGVTYRINRRFSVYTDLAMQTSTSEFFANVSGAGTGMSVPTGFNCFFTLEAGLQVALY